MEQAIATILSGDLDTASLLILFIIGILTKRFVPWWIHEEVVHKLDEYEEAAPALMDEVSHLIDLLTDNDLDRNPRERITSYDREKREAIRRIRTKREAVAQPHRRKRNK